MLTKAALMECSNETLVLWASMIQDEADRRQVNIEAVAVHPGNIQDGVPTPPAVRLLRSLLTLPPADIAKLDTIVSGWLKERA